MKYLNVKGPVEHQAVRPTMISSVLLLYTNTVPPVSYNPTSWSQTVKLSHFNVFCHIKRYLTLLERSTNVHNGSLPRPQLRNSLDHRRT